MRRRRGKPTAIPSYSGPRLLVIHAQFPPVAGDVVAQHARVAVGASHLKVPMVRRKPRVEHFRDLDPALAERERPRRLFAAMARITFDGDLTKINQEGR